MMAHDIILKDNSQNRNSADILLYIMRLHNFMQTLEKGNSGFLNKQENSSNILNSILKNIYVIIQSINTNVKEEIFFETNEIIANLNKLSISGKILINKSSSFKQNIAGNKELIEASVLLLSLIQLDEHKLKFANIYLDINQNFFTIQTPNFIKYSPEQKDIISFRQSHKYIKRKKRFYGVYLIFIRKIVEGLEGKLKVYVQGNKYKIFISLPIKAEKIQPATPIEKKSENILDSLNKKILIYSNSRYIAHKVENFLSKHKLDVDIKIKQKIEPIYPDFTKYGLLFIDTNIINKRMLNLLKKAKEQRVKFIFLDEKENKKEFSVEPDATLYKPFSYNDLVLAAESIFKKRKKFGADYIKENRILTHKKRVIIADDDTINLKLLEYKFKQYDLEVLTAKNGEEAIDLLEKFGADLIILDSIMPKMDGYQAAKYIRSKKKFSKIPIIIHSSFSFDKHTTGDIFHYGFDDFLKKPFDNRDFEKIVKRYLLKTKKREIKKDKKQFYAIYKDIDILIKKYAKNTQADLLLILLSDLKKELEKLKQNDLIEEIEILEHLITKTNYIDSNLIESFTKNLKNYIRELGELVNGG